MKKEYVTPVVEKIEFDYSIQTTTSGLCQVTNLTDAVGACTCGGMKMYSGNR